MMQAPFGAHMDGLVVQITGGEGGGRGEGGGDKKGEEKEKEEEEEEQRGWFVLAAIAKDAGSNRKGGRSVPSDWHQDKPRETCLHRFAKRRTCRAQDAYLVSGERRRAELKRLGKR